MISDIVYRQMRRYEQDKENRGTCTQTYTSEIRRRIATYIRISQLKTAQVR